jgi:FAD/FMN-containing dehydrogenase
MSTVVIETLDGSPTSLDRSSLDDVSDLMDGDLLTPDHPDYDEERALWNGMVDRHPALIARCRSAGDVARALGLAGDHGLVVSIRGGGHNIAGNAVCEGGLMISLAHMRGVEVDPEARTARVEPGATLADLDRATQAHGLATPVGINSTTGIAGLTLGGGFGWLSRKHGLTVDSLIAADVVLPSGERVRATDTENPDLFWALRGGGGNFGVVTSFELRLYPVGPEVLSGLIVHPFDSARSILEYYREFADGLPDEAAVWVVLRQAPPLPFLPEEWHGREVVVLAAFYAGDPAEGERVLQPLRDFGEPIADVIGVQPYADWQQAFDPLLTPGARNYWKSHDLAGLGDGVIDELLNAVEGLPTPLCEIFLAQMGGAISRVPAEATAYAGRDARYIMNIHTRWEDASKDGPCIEWARSVFDAVAPHSTGGVYVNFMPQDEADRVTRAYGANHARLVEIKGRYDPRNLLRMNQNIRPAVSA